MFLNTDSQQANEINQLLIGKLRIDFESITLTEEEFTIEGNGFVYQNENKELKLVFFRKKLIEENQKIEFLFKRGDGKGGLKSPTCVIKAVDKDRIIYSASCNFNPEISQNIEEFKIFRLKAVKEGQLNRVIFYGNYKIPHNSKYTTISTYKPYKESVVFNSINKIDSIDNSFEQRTCEEQEMWKIELSESIELNLCQFKNYVELLILTKEKLSDEIFEKILHTFDFLLGNKMQLVYYSVKNIGSCYYTVDNISSTTVSMTPPLIKSEEPKIKSEYSRLFKSYFQYIHKANKEQYEYFLKSHRRIVASSRLYSFNFGQSLAIQIEYLASKFFKDYKLTLFDDKEFKGDVESLIDFVNAKHNFKHTNSKKWILDRLEPGVSKEKWSKAKLINQLITDNVVYGIFKSWYSLRNSSAHGSSSGSSHEELIKWIYDCIEIYYTMIYYIIGHEGIYSRPKVDDFASYETYKITKLKK